MAQELRIVSVTFEINAQSYTAGRFSIPVEVRRILGVADGDKIPVVVETEAGAFAYTEEMKSGPEYYGAELRKRVASGERLRVTAYHP